MTTMTIPDFGRCTYDREDIGRCVNTATHYFVRENPTKPTETALVCNQHMMGDGKDNRHDYGWVEMTDRISETSIHVAKQLTRIRRAVDYILAEPSGSDLHETSWALLFDLLQSTPYDQIREAAKTAIRRLFTVYADD